MSCELALAAGFDARRTAVAISAVAVLFSTSAACWSAAPVVNAASTAASAASDSKLRQLMEQAQLRNGGPAAAAGGTGYTGAIAPERLHQRALLLQAGEAALARLELDAAIDAFDRAALIQHAADTEISLVRAYMQGGQYRRSLASGAHTAGAHLDVVAGSALYAWLLSAGGQGVIGQRLLIEAGARLPNNPVVASVQQQLQSGAPLATGVLLGLPTRLAPYSSGPVLPRTAQVVGSAVLLAGGQQALAPLALLPKPGAGTAASVWVRNGMGALSTATVVARLPGAGVAVLALGSTLPVADSPGVAATEAFPGSAAFAVEYSASPDAQAAWPLLRSGFLGGMTQNPAHPEERALGITMPAGPRGGPVFDVAGRLIGMALAPHGKQRAAPPILVSAPTLRRALALVSPTASLGALPATLAATSGALTSSNTAGIAAAPGRVPVDVIYENAMRSTLQLITLR